MGVNTESWQSEAPYTVSHPVFGREMVVASQPLAAQAGLTISCMGGNAVDAAIAAAAVLAVVEPTNNGVGGDAFAMVWDGSQLHGINATGCAPAGVDVDAVRAKHGKTMPETGWDSVTVPGAVSAWAELSRRFGTLPFADLLKPAINYAEQGFHVSPLIAEKWAQECVRLEGSATFRQHFTIDGRAPAAGQLFRQPELADTLRRIAATNGADFYTGKTAELISAHATENQAALTYDDLKNHQPIWVDGADIPSVQFGGANVYEMPPNGQGIIALYALALLKALKIENYAPDSVESVHLQIECIKKAFATLASLIADPAVLQGGYASIFEPDAINTAIQDIAPDKAGTYAQAPPPLAGTVYLATGDNNGMMVSLIQSNYMGFGSGVVVPGTGMALQNRAAGFSIDGSTLSQLQPGKRPFHTILPGFLKTEQGDIAVFGSTGGNFQPQGHVQIVTRLQLYGQNPQEVVNAPRFKVNQGNRVTVEPGFDPSVVEKLSQWGHDIHVSDGGNDNWGYGGMQILLRRDGRYIGGRDFRRDSHIAVV